MIHHCHAHGCERRVPPRMFSCLAHWRSLPKKAQEAIWRHYRVGQETRKDPSAAYLAAQRYAVAYLARKDDHQEASAAAIFDAVMYEAKAREGGVDPLAGLDRFWEK